jgi:2-dehydro-3-deoxyglucarate aldolase
MKHSLKHKLSAGEVCIGGWLGTGSVMIAEAVASCGFDWVAIDMEHGTASVDHAAGIFAALQNQGAGSLVRLPSADPYLARRLLDTGADGLIVPVVESAESFQDFSQHCLYPPAGKRGVGLSRCNLWGDQFEDYFKNFSPVLIPQIETVKGANNAVSIAALEEVDGLFIGPYDLSADYGIPGKLTDDRLKTSIAKVKDACAANGKAFGGHQVPPDMAALQSMIDEGFRLIAYSTDTIAMRHVFSEIRNLQK